MFVILFSGHEYEEPSWPIVFELESMILGILVEDFGSLANFSLDETKDHVRECFASFGFPHGSPLPHPSPEWIDQFLDREVPFMRTLIDEQSGQAFLSHRHPKLALKEQKLRDCTQRSKVFSTFIQSKGSQTGHGRS